MSRYFGTFLSGVEKIVEEILHSRLKNVSVLQLLDGAVEFETDTAYSDLNLFCFNNLFLVLHSEDTGSDEAALKSYLRSLPNAGADWNSAKNNSSKYRSFRLVISLQNRLISVENSVRSPLEKQISRVTGMRVDRSRPDAEFWVLCRSEGCCRFLKRLSRHTAYDKLLQPGELHPELAFIMCWLTSPSHSDTVMDPFSGHGAIPLQRCKRFPFTRLYAFDKSPEMVRETEKKLPKKPEVTAAVQDALRLSEAVPPESVDAVITDPPWGLYEDVGMELSLFYRLVLEQLAKVLKPGGRLSLLTAGKDEFKSAAEALPCFALRQEYRILVSGKKCGLFLLIKI